MGNGEAHRRFWLESLRERGQFENIGVCGRITLMNLHEVEWEDRAGLICLRIGTGGGLL